VKGTDLNPPLICHKKRHNLSLLFLASRSADDYNGKQFRGGQL